MINIISNYSLGELEKSYLSSCSNKCSESNNFVFNENGKFDLVCVLNHPGSLTFGCVPRNRTVKIVQEPYVEGSRRHRFVWKHNKFFSVVVGHREVERKFQNKPRFIERSPFLFPQVEPIQNPLNKVEKLSIIASTIDYIPGHSARNAFVDSILASHNELRPHTFGRGRNEIESKNLGLDKYMYSLAVENESIDSYVTEKFWDCILRETVPVYFGAPNIAELVDERCFISLPRLDKDDFKRILGKLNETDYLQRLHFLRQAKAKYINSGQLCCFLNDTLNKTKPQRIRLYFQIPPFSNYVLKLKSKILRIINSKVGS